MSNGDRGGNSTARLAWVAGIALAVGVFITGGLTAWQLTQYEQRAIDRSAQYAADADYQIEQSCFDFPEGAEEDCARIADYAARNEQRDEYDLYAQRVMALWTLVLGVAGIFGVILTAFGIYLIWATLIATRDMTIATREIGEIQSRAYMTIETRIESLGKNESDEIFSFQVELKNTGKTPAINIVVSVAGKIGPTRPVSEIEFDDMHSAGETSFCAADGVHTMIAAIGFPIALAQQVRDEQASLFLLVRIEYSDVFGDKDDFEQRGVTTGNLLDGGLIASQLIEQGQKQGD